MNTSEKYAVVESFGSSLIASPKFFTLLKDLEMLENLFLIQILKDLFSAKVNIVLLKKLLRLILSCFPPVLKIQIKVFQKKI